jgi:polysaccharide export outer membrane protein
MGGITMSKKGILLILSMALWTIALWAFPLPEERKAIASREVPSPTGNGAQASSRGEAPQPSLARRDPRYQLCRGDVLELDFPFTPEFNQTLTVQPDGYITLRAVGDLHVEGQTVPEVTQALQTAYRKILRDPVITIALKDFDKPYFIVSGQVGRPGKYDLRGDTTVTQALAIAGGFNDSAKHSQVLLFRQASSDWVEVMKVNLKQMLRAQNLSEDLHLRPGDMLFVPKSAVSKIKPWIPYPSLGMYLNQF